ncbi:MAG: radical SAM protein [Acidobacteria bacterium]|nr:radical SAM protein [Acidobacteriota bacterium]
MDYNLELIKRYGRVMMGGVTSPVILNILITSVCDMRCTHCFFTEELDDKERKKFQMTTEQTRQCQQNTGRQASILIIAGGEPFTRKDLPEVVRAFYENNQLESVYLMSNGGIQQRIIRTSRGFWRNVRS